MKHDLDQTFKAFARQATSEEIEKAFRLIEAGYFDLLDKIAAGEIDVDAAMQIFDGRQS